MYWCLRRLDIEAAPSGLLFVHDTAPGFQGGYCHLCKCRRHLACEHSTIPFSLTLNLLSHDIARLS
jgi:hypothetical protein